MSRFIPYDIQYYIRGFLSQEDKIELTNKRFYNSIKDHLTYLPGHITVLLFNKIFEPLLNVIFEDIYNISRKLIQSPFPAIKNTTYHLTSTHLNTMIDLFIAFNSVKYNLPHDKVPIYIKYDDNLRIVLSTDTSIEPSNFINHKQFSFMIRALNLLSRNIKTISFQSTIKDIQKQLYHFHILVHHFHSKYYNIKRTQLLLKNNEIIIKYLKLLQ